MASTLTLQADAPGKGAKRPVFAGGSRAILIQVWQVAFGNPYVVGGEDITSVFADFADVLAINVSQVDATIADRRDFAVVLSTKKLIMFTAFNTESTAVDQSAVADVRLTVIGYAK